MKDTWSSCRERLTVKVDVLKEMILEFDKHFEGVVEILLVFCTVFIPLSRTASMACHQSSDTSLRTERCRFPKPDKEIERHVD